MALGSIALEICAKWLFNLAPPLITRWLLPPEKLARKIKLQLGAGQSIKFSYQNNVCTFQAQVMVQNKSALRCTIDRVVLRFDPLSELNEFVNLQAVVIEPIEDQTIHFRKTLSETETASIKRFFVGNQLSHPRFFVSVVIHSPIGLVLKSDWLTYPGDISNPLI